MIIINKKKFLAELSKLLTFMYEEDRQEAVALYEQMFDDAVDEVELMQFLASPTKQAVIVARAYNAKERRLGVTSQAGDEAADISGDQVPAFVEAINGLYSKALEMGIVTSQFSDVFSDDYPDSVSEEAGEEESAENPAVSEEGSEEVQEEDTSSESEQPSEPAEIEFPEIVLEVPDEVTQFLAGTSDTGSEEPEEPSTEDEPSEAPVSEEGSFSETEQPEEPAAETPSGEDEFNFSLDLGPVPTASRSDVNEINEAMAAFQVKEGNGAIVRSPQESQTTLSEFEEAPAETALPWKREPEKEETSSGTLVVPMVILYLIAAVPLTALCIAVLLIPTLVFLGLAIIAGVYSFRFITLAFGNFAVFADIMAVLGGGLVLLALALLFFWIFLWFIGAAIAGLINAVIRLGGKICYKGGNAHE